MGINQTSFGHVYKEISGLVKSKEVLVKHALDIVEQIEMLSKVKKKISKEILEHDKKILKIMNNLFLSIYEDLPNK